MCLKKIDYKKILLACFEKSYIKSDITSRVIPITIEPKCTDI